MNSELYMMSVYEYMDYFRPLNLNRSSSSLTIQEPINNLRAEETRRQPYLSFIDEEVGHDFLKRRFPTNVLNKQRRIIWQVINSCNRKNQHEERDEDSQSAECAVCMLPVELPVRLQCRHEFCFTCAKGLMRSTKSCALCRAPIPSDLASNPNKYLVGELPSPGAAEHAWFYESSAGWWLYTPRMQTDVENAYRSGEKILQISFNGQACVLDFEKSVQAFEVEGEKRIQRIKRDSKTTRHLGVAGLKYCSSPDSNHKIRICLC